MGAASSRKVKPTTSTVGSRGEAAKQTLAGSYKAGKILGKGGFSTVMLCTDRTTGEKFACKTIHKSSPQQTQADREAVMSEIQVMTLVKGQDAGLVQLREVIESEAGVHLIMELCGGGDLYQLLKAYGPLPEPAARLVLRQLASALQCLHAQGIVHRDVKIRNILFDGPAACLYSTTSSRQASGNAQLFTNSAPVHARLADFGLSVVLPTRGGRTTGCAGTLRFTAPEILKNLPYGVEVDIWSLGVVLCTMLTGRNPFAGVGCEDEPGIVRAITGAKVDFSLFCWKKVSSEAKDLVCQLLQVDPAKRVTATDLLKHPWFWG